MPGLTTWGIWTTRNSMIFEEEYKQTFQSTTQILSLMKYYKEEIKSSKPWVIGELRMDKSNCWIFFYGTCQGPKKICGIMGILHTYEHHYITLKENNGKGTNNKDEQLPLKTLLKLDFEEGV